MQRLADIDIAEPGDEASGRAARLFNGVSRPASSARQRGAVEFVAERLDAEVGEKRMRVEIARSPQAS